MAKLKAPLMSLGASGALGKSLVFFPWKGLDCVREYVIPSNPKSDPQNTQRGYLTSAVKYIHEAEADVTHPLLAVDKSAYALYGSCEPTPRTWFNQMVKRWILAWVKGEDYMYFTTGAFTDPATTQITITLWNMQVAAQPGYMYCGTSKTALTTKVAANGAAHIHTGVFTSLTAGVKYYFQFRPTKLLDDKYVCRSGIYYHVCT